MSYLVLARKWRPRGFDDLIGQEPISRILINALSQGKIAHAYVFSGPRGVGKTSTARILAKALNCEGGPTPTPCGTCGFCVGITDGSSVDVMEIDGASNNSVNDIRDLRERVKYAPAGGRYKVYIIDEAHMLSDSAFNALLKTLEEPPPHVVFVLATTAPRKIPATVLSRCQHLPFRRVPLPKITQRLRQISDSEGIRVSEGAIDMIGRAADGSMRDSLTILDQVSAFSSDIREADVYDLLGIADFRAVSEIAGAVIGGDRKRILEIIRDLADAGTDFKSFARDLMNFSRDLVVAKIAEKPEQTLDVSDDEMAVIKDILKTASEDHLTVLLSEMLRVESEVRLSFSPRVALEMALLKASFLSELTPVKEALENIQSLVGEQKKTPRVPKERPVTPPLREAEEAGPGKQASKEEEPLLPVSRKTLEGTRDQGETAGETASPAPVPEVSFSEFWTEFMKRIEALNHPLACRLLEADARIESDVLHVTFNGGSAIHVDSVNKYQERIEEIASGIVGRTIRIAVETAKKRVPRKKDLKEKILSEPLVKEAIELFEGRILDVKPREKSEEGGQDV